MHGFNTSRIPALVYKDGTFIAFCEARKDTFKDIGNMDIIARRGKLTGNEILWDEPSVVVTMPGRRVMNPTPIVDRVRNCLLLVFVSFEESMNQYDLLETGTLQQGLYYTKSFDDGLTWSNPVDITSSTLARMKQTPAMFATGPGHGIQLTSGRLIVPANVFFKDTRGSSDQRGCINLSTVVYSDDGGTTWHMGGRVPLGTDRLGKYIQTNEVQAVELENNVVCLNSRTLSSYQTRATSCSEDAGQTFGFPSLAYNLIEPGFKLKKGVMRPGNYSGCQASILAFPAPEETVFSEYVSNTWVLFSNPADASVRKDSSIRLSTDGMKSWSLPWTFNHEAGGYSDLTYFETYEGGRKVQNFGLLYERGHRKSSEAIVFRTFSLTEVLGGIM
ncbi:sialidase-3-like [Ptychodera flava]|uniref:sialidase-3-like n=1 Tax=Ptychodera flava TaxID=63121 RepID=UPI00396A23CC